MRLHSDVIGWREIHTALTAAQEAGRVAPHVFFYRDDRLGSRSRKMAWELQLGTTVKVKRDGRGYKNTGQYGAMSERNTGEGIWAATYDEWGWFIVELYRIDPDLILGQYRTRADFERITQNKYSLVPQS